MRGGFVRLSPKPLQSRCAKSFNRTGDLGDLSPNNGRRQFHPFSRTNTQKSQTQKWCYFYLWFLFLVLYSISEDKSLVWKLTDFGFSSPASLTVQKPALYGRIRLNYCAPELLISSHHDNKVDIWSAGCILYELATGTQAFENGDAVRKHAWGRSAAPSVSHTRSDLTRSVDEMVGQMVDVLPEQRPDAASVCQNIAK